MDERYAIAIIDELERIGDLLESFLALHEAELLNAGTLKNPTMPRRFARRANDKRSATLATGAKPGQP